MGGGIHNHKEGDNGHKEDTKKCPQTLRTKIYCFVTYEERNLRKLGRHRAGVVGRPYLSFENYLRVELIHGGSQRLLHRERARILGSRIEES